MISDFKGFYSDLIDEQISASKQSDFGLLVHRGKFGLERYEFSVNGGNRGNSQKPIGDYVTINCSRILAHLTSVQDYVATEIAYSLRKFLIKSTKKENPFVLVVGLGNKNMIADSLGARVIESLLITHNVPELLKQELGDMAAFVPGVGGQTGISTFDILHGVVERVNPDVIIAIDALTAASEKRLGCSFQMTNAGLTPGAGVGNSTTFLSEQTIGVPVIGVGVPMMVSANGICLNNSCSSGIFAPKEVDIFISKCTRTLAIAINLAVHGKVYKDYC